MMFDRRKLERTEDKNRELATQFQGLKGKERFRVSNALQLPAKALNICPRALDYAYKECQKISEKSWANGRPTRFVSQTALAHEYGVSERTIRAWEDALAMVGIIFRINPRARRHGGPGGGGINFAPIAINIDHFEKLAQEHKNTIQGHRVARNDHYQLVRALIRLIERLKASQQTKAAEKALSTLDDTRLKRIDASVKVSQIQKAVGILEKLKHSIIEALASVENCIEVQNTSDRTDSKLRHTELQLESPYPTDTSSKFVDKWSRSKERVSQSKYERPSCRSCREKDWSKVHSPDQEQFSSDHDLDAIIHPALLAASPEFITVFERASGSIWDKFKFAALTMCQKLGIHESAFRDAVSLTGEKEASLCVLVVDRKHRFPQDHAKHVISPGGYYRKMTRRAASSELNVIASIFGLAEETVQ